ncbi:MAG: matrixin family metalloprotease [Planctomycetes bacterium]|nr:matrixin family metalloprotease [Planctomycetota bacterium]
MPKPAMTMCKPDKEHHLDGNSPWDIPLMYVGGFVVYAPSPFRDTVCDPSREPDRGMVERSRLCDGRQRPACTVLHGDCVHRTGFPGSFAPIMNNPFRYRRTFVPLTCTGIILGSCTWSCGNASVPAGDGQPKTDPFLSATVAQFNVDGLGVIEGSVGRKGDLDPFLLGPMSAGDRLTIDADTGSSPLDVSIGIFDADQRLVFANDDRAPFDLDAFADITLRHGSDAYFLVVTHSAFAEKFRETGTYSITIQHRPGSIVPPAVGQTILLDFDGGNVESPVLGEFSVEPFSGERIASVYAGKTDELKRGIRETMEQNFSRFDVTIVTTDDPLPENDAPVSTIFFGGFDARAFGQAEGVDLYNAEFCDDAIIFAESFTTNLFSTTPTAGQMAIAIGNVASHEAGHLLGLNHVADDDALMDDRSAADAFLRDQEFIEAPLSTDVMPIGVQDAALLLFETVGPRT